MLEPFVGILDLQKLRAHGVIVTASRLESLSLCLALGYLVKKPLNL